MGKRIVPALVVSVCGLVGTGVAEAQTPPTGADAATRNNMAQMRSQFPRARPSFWQRIYNLLPWVEEGYAPAQRVRPYRGDYQPSAPMPGTATGTYRSISRSE